MAAIKFYFGLIFLGVTAFLSSFVCNQPAMDSVAASTDPVISIEESRDIAREYLKKSPTYAFDGIEGTLELIETESLRCQSCWTFIFQFQSSHAGYGNRMGKAVIEVVTPHKAEITVVRGDVTQAELDGWWDMIEQEKM